MRDVEQQDSETSGLLSKQASADEKPKSRRVNCGRGEQRAVGAALGCTSGRVRDVSGIHRDKQRPA